MPKSTFGKPRVRELNVSGAMRRFYGRSGTVAQQDMRWKPLNCELARRLHWPRP